MIYSVCDSCVQNKVANKEHSLQKNNQNLPKSTIHLPVCCVTITHMTYFHKKLLLLCYSIQVFESAAAYHRVPKVVAPITFGISRPEGPQLSGGRYFWVAVTFG